MTFQFLKKIRRIPDPLTITLTPRKWGARIRFISFRSVPSCSVSFSQKQQPQQRVLMKQNEKQRRWNVLRLNYKYNKMLFERKATEQNRREWNGMNHRSHFLSLWILSWVKESRIETERKGMKLTGKIRMVFGTERNESVDWNLIMRFTTLT